MAASPPRAADWSSFVRKVQKKTQKYPVLRLILPKLLSATNRSQRIACLNDYRFLVSSTCPHHLTTPCAGRVSVNFRDLPDEQILHKEEFLFFAQKPCDFGTPPFFVVHDHVAKCCYYVVRRIGDEAGDVSTTALDFIVRLQRSTKSLSDGNGKLFVENSPFLREEEADEYVKRFLIGRYQLFKDEDFQRPELTCCLQDNGCELYLFLRDVLLLGISRPHRGGKYG